MRLERRAVVDEYVEEGEGVYLLPDHLVVALSPLPTAVMRLLADGPQHLSSVVVYVLARFGPPAHGNVETAVEAIVSELSDLGLVALEI